ncbi:uncharacterized protein MONBRDRAFT_30005 [Monosiga brevicollis MX1]|uniref:Uncharacterized protein n=1 Tax=Monosiga brevicollis TaxID=81824 RepID=A9VCR2_MONBE|nr:uncharacterized protein MONBRDRAFT_30005 [Monosiga brevicollis MX1]EDQ84693.1 predicted protein [Monosiga brevicollis MX1]|eukprot:XP_001750479.1 hypothetical protein [Monosiga brevicollis MX1]
MYVYHRILLFYDIVVDIYPTLERSPRVALSLCVSQTSADSLKLSQSLSFFFTIIDTFSLSPSLSLRDRRSLSLSVPFAFDRVLIFSFFISRRIKCRRDDRATEPVVKMLGLQSWHHALFLAAVLVCASLSAVTADPITVRTTYIGRSCGTFEYASAFYPICTRTRFSYINNDSLVDDDDAYVPNVEDDDDTPAKSDDDTPAKGDDDTPVKSDDDDGHKANDDDKAPARDRRADDDAGDDDDGVPDGVLVPHGDYNYVISQLVCSSSAVTNQYYADWNCGRTAPFAAALAKPKTCLVEHDSEHSEYFQCINSPSEYTTPDQALWIAHSETNGGPTIMAETRPWNTCLTFESVPTAYPAARAYILSATDDLQTIKVAMYAATNCLDSSSVGIWTQPVNTCFNAKQQGFEYDSALKYVFFSNELPSQAGGKAQPLTGGEVAAIVVCLVVFVCIVIGVVAYQKRKSASYNSI